MKKTRKTVFALLGGWGSTSAKGRLFDQILVGLILANIIAFTLETIDAVDQLYGPYLRGFEFLCVVIFTVEYAARVWSSVENPRYSALSGWRARLRYMRTPVALIDLIAILPFYLGLIGLIPGGDGRALRAIRMLRILKLGRYSRAMQAITAALIEDYRTMMATLIVVLVGIYLSAALIFIAERTAQPEHFGNIPDAMWWSIVTLTTVGYGDVTPATPIGKVIGAFVMLSGIGLFALWTGIFAFGFTRQLNMRAFKPQWEMIGQSPVFSQLPSESLIMLADRAEPLIFPRRHILLDPTEQPDRVFVVVSGSVHVSGATTQKVLEPGHVFGPPNHPGDGLYHVGMTVYTDTDAKLLALDPNDVAGALRV